MRIELLPAASTRGRTGDPGAYGSQIREPGPRWLLAAGLLAATCFTTTTLGAMLVMAARSDLPTVPESYARLPLLTAQLARSVWSDPELLRLGALFGVSAMTILLCHELGHYLACRFYRLPSSLPYFLPLPFALGTLGAFIRIRGPIRAKRELFDVGIAGPLAGFIALLPFLFYGLAHSAVSPFRLASLDLAEVGVQLPGQSVALALATWLVHGNLHGALLDYHPFVLGAWFGLFATSFNLVPLSQLDGGHILYAAAPAAFRRLSRPLWLALVLFGFVFRVWWVLVLCVLVLVVTGLRHPPVHDEHIPLDPRRRALAWLAALVFLSSFMPVPIRQQGLTSEPDPSTVLAAAPVAVPQPPV